MADAGDNLTRLALFEAWDEKCVWCGKPVFFDEMEVEHLLPKSLKGDARKTALADHGRDPDFDLNALENLAPSCGPCNRGKGKKLPPTAPIITTLLETAKEKAPGVRDTAARFKDNRRIQRSLPVVMEAAKAGNDATLAALREAVGDLTVGVTEETGRESGRLHSTVQELTGVGEVLSKSDTFFSYPATTHESEGPAPPITPGTVISVSETAGAVTSRIDAVPRHGDALARYGPQFTLSATDDEAGARATASLAAALREGQALEIGEGMDLTFDRLPPLFEHLVGQRLTGGALKIGEARRVRRPIPDWDAVLRAETEGGTSSVRVRLRQAEEVPDGWDDAAVGRFGGLTATVSWRERNGKGELSWNFKHQRDASPVREQLAALQFLDALSRGGELVVVDRGKSNRPDVRTPCPPAEVAPEGRTLLTFLEDVRTLEIWTGREFVLPDELSWEEAQQIATLATIVRNRGRPVTWNEARLTVAQATLEQLGTGKLMTIEQNTSVIIFGTQVEFGSVRTELPAYDVTSAEPATEAPGYVDVRIAPSDSTSAEIFERITKVSKPPPPPPKKVLRARTKSRQKSRKRH
jgi:hypothetical protein